MSGDHCRQRADSGPTAATPREEADAPMPGPSRDDRRGGTPSRSPRPDRAPRPERSGSGGDDRRREARPRRDDARRGRPTKPPARAGSAEAHRPPRPPREEGPPIPDDVTPDDLDRSIRAELRALPEHRAESVARHLVMAGLLIDDDPDTAYLHAQAARGGAGRVAAVREAIGLTAYRTGRYAEALAELRAARRMNGAPDHLPVMADAERGLGRPERALALANDPDVKQLDKESAVELRIVLAGARRDLGQHAAAVGLLEGPDLDPPQIEPWTVRLWYAYADALLAAGRTDDARSYFAAAADADLDDETDAAERVAALETEPGADAGD